jgi:hypothetical protein
VERGRIIDQNRADFESAFLFGKNVHEWFFLGSQVKN